MPPQRVVDLDIYRLPGSERDFLEAWTVAAERAPARLVWTHRNGGHWIVLGGLNIAHVYADFAHYSSRISIVPRLWGELYPLRPTTLDPPDHIPYQHILNRLLSDDTVKRAQPMVRTFAARAAESLQHRGECDFVADYAAGLPAALFAGLAGMDPERMRNLPRYAEHLVAKEGATLSEPVMNRYAAFHGALIEERRSSPGDDIVSELLAAPILDRPISDEEATELATAVLTGGLDTIVSMLALMIRHLAEDHELRRRLASSPALAPKAVRELVQRLPIMTKARLVRRDHLLDGVMLKAGDMILMPPLHGLDPAVFPDPLRVDLDRARTPHSTYGNGVHRCPGAKLAEAEMAIMLTE